MVDLSLMPGLLLNDSSICFGEKKERKTICSSIFKQYMLMFGVIHRGRKRSRRTLSAVSKQFHSLSSPRLVPSPSALRPLLLGGRVTVSGSLEPHAHLRILAFFTASASIRSRRCVQLHV